MMTNIKFSHWFWITSVTLFFHCNLVFSIDNEELVLFKNSAEREAKSISSSSHTNDGTAEVSTSRSVSVSHVRVEVGRENVYSRLRKIRKIAKKNKRNKMKKSFLENIYSKLKEFARVTLASRRVSARKKAAGFSDSELTGAPGLNNSGNTSHAPIILTQLTPGPPADGEWPSQVPSDDMKDQADDVPGLSPLLTKQTPEEPKQPLNVMSFNEFSDGPELVDTNDVSESKNVADIETSSTRQVRLQDTGELFSKRARSDSARGRSLWRTDQAQERPRASFASFTQERAVVFDSSQSKGLLPWTNVIILGVSMVTVFAFVSVLVVAVLYRRAKTRAPSHCDQFSDILSTSSRSSSSSSSTFSSTRSGKNVPDKIDNISFHSEGQLRKSVYTCDDLYSLDSDYFLSSLEDISVQI